LGPGARRRGRGIGLDVLISDDATIAVPAAAEGLQPLIGLSFAAAAISIIGVATGVLLLLEHNDADDASARRNCQRSEFGR
jgi:hypothetical protein